MPGDSGTRSAQLPRFEGQDVYGNSNLLAGNGDEFGLPVIAERIPPTRRRRGLGIHGIALRAGRHAGIDCMTEHKPTARNTPYARKPLEPHRLIMAEVFARLVVASDDFASGR